MAALAAIQALAVALPAHQALRARQVRQVRRAPPVRPGAWAAVVVLVVEWPVRRAPRAPEWWIHA